VCPLRIGRQARRSRRSRAMPAPGESQHDSCRRDQGDRGGPVPLRRCRESSPEGTHAKPRSHPNRCSAAFWVRPKSLRSFERRGAKLARELICTCPSTGFPDAAALSIRRGGARFGYMPHAQSDGARSRDARRSRPEWFHTDGETPEVDRDGPATQKDPRLASLGPRNGLPPRCYGPAPSIGALALRSFSAWM
jgi:hypothetical protein